MVDESTRRERRPVTIEYGKLRATIPQLALSLMLIGIIAPPVMYAVRLDSPTPTQLITTICISVFASVLFLWILDATAVFRFRSVWMSRSIYSIAIASILSASIGIYKDAFTDHLHPYDGVWRVSAWAGSGERLADNLELILYYSKSSAAYQGFSSLRDSIAEKAIQHIWIERFDPGTRTMIATVTTTGDLQTHQMSEGEPLKELRYD